MPAEIGAHGGCREGRQPYRQRVLRLVLHERIGDHVVVPGVDEREHRYLDLYWKHLSQYYQNGKITREQWLQQCNQIKPQTH